MQKLVTFKMDQSNLEQVDKYLEEFGFENRTEFIRAAIREKIEEYRMKRALFLLEKNRGYARRKGKIISDNNFKRAREIAFKELEKEIK